MFHKAGLECIFNVHLKIKYYYCYIIKTWPNQSLFFLESDSILCTQQFKPKNTHFGDWTTEISLCVCVWNKANHFLLSDFDILTLRTNECQKNLRLPSTHHVNYYRTFQREKKWNFNAHKKDQAVKRLFEQTIKNVK